MEKSQLFQHQMHIKYSLNMENISDKILTLQSIKIIKHVIRIIDNHVTAYF